MIATNNNVTMEGYYNNRYVDKKFHESFFIFGADNYGKKGKKTT